VRRDLEEIIARLSALPGLKHVAMTTNGVTLHRRLEALRDAGLNLVNISLDTLVPEKFELLTRRRGHDRVLRSVRRAVELGFDPVKVNVVLMRGVNDDELLDFVAMTKDDPINVRFIEYMPFDGNKWETRKVVSYAEARGRVADAHPSMRRVVDDKTESTLLQALWTAWIGIHGPMEQLVVDGEGGLNAATGPRPHSRLKASSVTSSAVAAQGRITSSPTRVCITSFSADPTRSWTRITVVSSTRTASASTRANGRTRCSS
jgi:sulfatase maturation enzyme AslB (radical SAM superfamily)